MFIAWLRRFLVFALLPVMLAPAPAAAGPASVAALPRLWDATIVVDGVQVPFAFEIVRGRGAIVASFFNGSRRISSTAGEIAGERLLFSFAQYGATLAASLGEGRLAGEYRRGSKTVYPFSAVPAAHVHRAAGDAPSIAGTWIVQARSSKGETAWRFIAREEDGRVTATILRVDGDTGTLTGSFDDGRYVLSHFSGARPLLLEVFPRADGTLQLRQNGRMQLTAVREGDPRAAAIGVPADPDRHTGIRDASAPFHFSFPDLSGTIVSDTDARFAGKVVLVSISGSWCPNCHDEAPFLASLYKKYRDRGFEVVTLSFEEKEQLANPERLRAFITTYGFQHTVLLAGQPDQVTELVPQAINLNAFPTSFILGRDGRVRAVHAGFPSPGSGAFYRQAETDVSRQIEQLLAERPEEKK
ncbi:MAG TPA: TlpA disulfide reductase family protein [Vicinamibacterales bacterium]|jgi:peroxiredoxin|nr:TlpA disulfide reductase family protein [Vicinamibacterales bacterium]